MPDIQTSDVVEETVFHIMPSEVQFKGRVRLEGQYLIGELWVQYAGLPPRKVTARVDMRAVVDELKAGATSTDPEIAGLFDFVKKGVKSISNAAKSIGRQKLVKGLSRGVKSVIRSPVTGSIVKAAGVVFPPVGVPAAAAYQGANATLAALDQRGNILRKLGAFGKHAAGGAVSMIPGIPPQIASAVDTFVKTGKLDPNLVRAAMAVAGPDAAKILQQGAQAAAMVRDLGARARAGDPRAAMQANVLRRVNTARQDITQKNAQLMALRNMAMSRPGVPRVPSYAQRMPQALPYRPPVSRMPVPYRPPVQPMPHQLAQLPFLRRMMYGR